MSNLVMDELIGRKPIFSICLQSYTNFDPSCLLQSLPPNVDMSHGIPKFTDREISAPIGIKSVVLVRVMQIVGKMLQSCLRLSIEEVFLSGYSERFVTRKTSHDWSTSSKNT